MRSLCAFHSSRAAACAAFLSLMCLLSCSSAPPPGIETDELDVLEGEVAIIGGDPFERRIMLADTSGAFWTLGSSRLLGELMNLAGHYVRVEGTLVRQPGAKILMQVDSYKLLPVDGRLPLVGTLLMEDGRPVLLEEGTGERYFLVGPLDYALMNFTGLRLWVLGEEEAGERESESGVSARRMNVINYGVLGPAPDVTNATSPGTPQD